jgi:hypothetical protein
MLTLADVEALRDAARGWPMSADLQKRLGQALAAHFDDGVDPAEALGLKADTRGGMTLQREWKRRRLRGRALLFAAKRIRPDAATPWPLAQAVADRPDALRQGPVPWDELDELEAMALRDAMACGGSLPVKTDDVRALFDYAPGNWLKNPGYSHARTSAE